MTLPDDRTRKHIRCVSDFLALVGKKMKQCAEYNQRQCSQQLEDGRITAQEFAIVLALTEYGTMPVKEIASRLQGVSLSTLTRMLDKLESSEFITRTLDPGDRRSFLISATDKARAAEESYKRQVDQVAESMIECLTAEERQQLIELLGKMRLQLRGESPQ
ncbi:MarR family winged helix-turn-helix transcriptional regulator [Paenibacillus chartarius]|uniref:MarR family winged helix-turn-helix transcriptional regulator n=1 Tax=Paenibacillus chartarius TaxID=747481 RepID=A0ABV6DEU2_9BACL